MLELREWSLLPKIHEDDVVEGGRGGSPMAISSSLPLYGNLKEAEVVSGTASVGIDEGAMPEEGELRVPEALRDSDQNRVQSSSRHSDARKVAKPFHCCPGDASKTTRVTVRSNERA